MKRIVFILGLLMLTATGYAQSFYFLRGDSIVIEKGGGNGELILKNAGRDSEKGGVLYNKGGGRTAFKRSVALNDSTFIVGGDTIVIKGGVKGGSNTNLATASLTATGEYIHDWDNKWLHFNSLKGLNLNSDAPDPNHPGNKKIFKFYSDSTIENDALQLMWGMKNTDGDFFDSLRFELTSRRNGTFLNHHVDGGAKYTVFELTPGAFNPYIAMYVGSASKYSYFQFGPTASLEPNDSVRARLIFTPGATQMVTARSEFGGIYTLGVADMPAAADSSIYSTNYRRDTAVANLRTQIAGKQPLGNYITGLNGDGSATGPGLANFVLSLTSVTPGSYTAANITVDAKGRITAASNGSVPSYTFTNGLVNSAGTVKLGSSLIENTDIDNAGFSFLMHGTGDNGFKTFNGTKQYAIATSPSSSTLTASNSDNSHFSEINAIDSSAILIGGKSGDFYNRLEVSKNEITLATRYNTTPHFFKLDLNGQLSADAYVGSAFQTIDTSYNTLVVDGSGNIFMRPGGNGGSTLTNVGSGFAWATTPNGSIKRFNPTYGLIGDSAMSNTISLRADTSSANHLVTQSDLNDAATTASSVGSGVGIFKEKSGFDLRFKSIVTHASVTAANNTNDVSIELVNDDATPGTNKVYGTDASGVKGYQSTTVVNLTSPVNGQILVYQDGEWVNVDNNPVIPESQTAFKVGVSGMAAGDSVYTDASLEGKMVKVYREGERMFIDTTYGIEVDTSTGTITFHPYMVAGEKIIIEAGNYSTSTPVITLEDLDFPTQTNLTHTGTTWSATNATSIYNGYGLSNKRLAAGNDGYIRARYTASDGSAAIIAFNTSNTSQKYADNPASPTVYHYEAAAFVFAGTLYRLDNNTAAASVGGISVGDYWRIIRTGSTLKLQTSPDASIWTDKYTYSFSSTADLYINANIDANTGSNKLYEPKGYNVQ